MRFKPLVHFPAALGVLALLASCGDSSNTSSPDASPPSQATSSNAPDNSPSANDPQSSPSSPALVLAPPGSPTTAFFVGGKTPEASLIPGNKPDIAGIRIGEPLNPDLVLKLNPAYEISKYRSHGRESGIRAYVKGDELEVMWNEAGIVWHVQRGIEIARDDRFMFDVFKTSLLEKYGQPSSEWKNSNVSYGVNMI
jgi:hypothetical protein